MSNKRFNITVPTSYTDGQGAEKKRYTTVGTAFLNTQEDGTQTISLKLNFPVGVTEMACFEPKAKEDEA